MSNITQFNRTNLKNLRKDLDKALAAVGAQYGIDIKSGSARFSDNNVTFKVEISIVTNGQVKTKGAVDLERYYPQFVGKKVAVNGKQGTVIEYHSRKHKYPFIVQVGTKNYKVPEYMVK